MLGYSRIGKDLHWLKKGIFQVMLLTAKRRMSKRHCNGIAQVNSYWIPPKNAHSSCNYKPLIIKLVIPIGLDNFEAWHVTAKSKSTATKTDLIGFDTTQSSSLGTWAMKGFCDNLDTPRRPGSEWMVCFFAVAIRLPVHVHTGRCFNMLFRCTLVRHMTLLQLVFVGGLGYGIAK